MITSPLGMGGGSDKERQQTELKMSEYDHDETLKKTYNQGLEDGRKSAMPLVLLFGFALLVIILQSLNII